MYHKRIIKGVPFRYQQITLISILISIDFNTLTDIILNMVRLRRAVDGSHFIVIRRALIESQAWQEGDEMVLLAVGSSDVIPKQGDYILRKIGSAGALK